MAENQTCKDHKMVCQEVTDLKKTVNDNRPIIEGKVGTKQMWTIISVFLVMAIAVVGFLWNEQRTVRVEQTAVRMRLEEYQDKLTGDQGVLTNMNNKLNRIEWTLTYHAINPTQPMPNFNDWKNEKK